MAVTTLKEIMDYVRTASYCELQSLEREIKGQIERVLGEDCRVGLEDERGPYGTNPDDRNIVSREHPDFYSLYSDFGPK